MTSRKLSLQARTLKSLSNYPGIVESIPSPVRFKGENELATQIQRNLRARNRYRTRKDLYFGESKNLTKNAIIRHILDEGFDNSFIIDLLYTGLINGSLSPENLKINIDDPYKTIEFLRCIYNEQAGRFFQQENLLKSLPKSALDKIYSNVAINDINYQNQQDRFNLETYGHVAPVRGGKRRKRKTRKTKRKSKKNKKTKRKL